jgi:hypothetical protein
LDPALWLFQLRQEHIPMEYLNDDFLCTKAPQSFPAYFGGATTLHWHDLLALEAGIVCCDEPTSMGLTRFAFRFSFRSQSHSCSFTDRELGRLLPH